MEKVNCSICGSDKSKKQYEVKGFNVNRCDDCGFFYINPRYSQEELNNLYSEDYFKAFSTQRKVDYMKDREFRAKDFQTRLEGIKRYKKAGRVLDVGCAAGFFLEVVQKQGWQACGVELSDYAASFARNELKLNVRTGELAAAKFEPGYFDVITFFDVIEHVGNPKGLVAEANRILKDDGLIVITTPNIDSFCARAFKDRFHLLDPLHLSYFSPKTLEKLLKAEGFKIVKIEYPYFKTPYFNAKELSRLTWNLLLLKMIYPIARVFNKNNGRMHQGIRSYSFYANMMCVYAVKGAK